MFFDRENERRVLWGLFMEGRNVLMLAPRRVGKTQLLNKLLEEGQEKGYRTILLDVEGRREEKDFFHEFCSAIQEEIGTGTVLLAAFTQRFRQAVQGKDSFKDWRELLLHSDWTEFAHHLLGELDKEKEGNWLILVDELPIFVLALLDSGGRDRVRDFLYGLRRLCQKFRNVRWLFTGSIGLDAVCRRESVEGALVDLELFELNPFPESIAGDFVREILKGKGCRLEEDALCRLLKGLGWLAPYYLEKLADEACRHQDASGLIRASSSEGILDAMLALSHRTYWSIWREHLDKNFREPERTGLFRVLEAIAKSTEGATKDTLLAALPPGESPAEGTLRRLLDTLEADGYLHREEDQSPRYRFRMELLRRWWLRYVVGEGWGAHG